MNAFTGFLPHLNAVLNGLSACCLISGYLLIRRKKIAGHKAAMLSAFAFSALFLIFYVLRQSLTGHTVFQGPDTVRMLYLIILGTHMVLAVPVVPLSLTLLILALRERIEKHRRLARWTLPIWLYVSITGVVVYVMLYHLYPQG